MHLTVSLLVVLSCAVAGAQPTAQPETGDDVHRANRLASETSPYLLQHAHNPVDWHPWGEEAFEAARERDVPIFLSIGYSTCYWCHVMEREVFENDQIAAGMNERYVCVKVDREERPDVDDIYMMATMLQNRGRGGWPMSVFLEPRGLRPFFTDTYIPPEPMMGRMGFPQISDAIDEAWKNQREQVMDVAANVAEAVADQLAAERVPVPVGRSYVTGAAGELLQRLDSVNGGIGQAPKFPQPAYVELLMDVREASEDEATLIATDQAIRLTLDKMAIGGMNDQVGGGFHRYSVDATWTVPHFEKMLYDNAQLLSLYARAARMYEDAYYAQVARETAAYVLREMRSPDGGFYSAQDAEVDGHEGLNYLWTEAQIREVLDDSDAALALKAYGLEAGTNFQDPHHPEDAPANVMRLSDRPEVVAAAMGMEPEAFGRRLASIDAALQAARAQRKQPRLDDKVLASWNGLMIAGLAEAGVALDDASLIDGARRAADFVLAKMMDGETLFRSYREGVAKQPGFLEDYAFVARGLIALHRALESTGEADERYLAAARRLVDIADAAFGDGSGAYYDTREGQSDLFVRTRSTMDGAVASGSSVMLNVLIDLHEVSPSDESLERAVRALESVSADIAANPMAPVESTRGLLRLVSIPETEGHPAFSDEAMASGPADFTPVEVFANTDRVMLVDDKPAEFSIRLSIADGYHLVAADPGAGGEDLVPLRVQAIGGTGLNVFADYAPGTSYDAPVGDEGTPKPKKGFWDPGPILVYTGEVEIRIAVQANEDVAWTGRPMVGLTFQACTDSECLLPITMELDVAIDRE
jgi:hypothetical protein